MSWSSKEGQQIGRIEAKVDDLVIHQQANGKRLTVVEAFVNRAKGITAFLIAIAGIVAAIILVGCAHMHTSTFYPTGELKSDTVSNVIGTGDTTLLFECEGGDQLYTTRDTGLSDNAVDTVKAAVQVTPPGAAAGAVEDVLGRLSDGN